MKKILAALLTSAALLLGFFLPTLSASAEDRKLKSVEPADIQQVSFALSSDLTIGQKMALFSDKTSTVLDVGVGQNQTSKTLSANCWRVIDVLKHNNAALLTPETAVQASQTAQLVSNGSKAFIVWNVYYYDSENNQVTFYIDDETGLPLSLEFFLGEKRAADANGASAGEISLSVMSSLLTMDSLLFESAVSFDGSTTSDGTTAETAAGSGSLWIGRASVSASDSAGAYQLPVEAGDGWALVNPLLGV